MTVMNHKFYLLLFQGDNSSRLLTSDSEAPNRPPRRKKVRGGGTSTIGRRKSVRKADVDGEADGGVSRRRSVRSIKRTGTFRRPGASVVVGSIGK